MDEIWKDIPDFEGLYEASSLGRIRSKEGKTTTSRKFPQRRWKSRILKSRGNSKSGARVSLWKDGKSYDCLAHRLIAITFLGYPPNPDYTVNHKDGNRLNNNVANLEWMTRADNIRYGFEHGQYPTQKEIALRTSSGEILNFRSMAECDRFLNRSEGYTSGRISQNKTQLISKNGHVFNLRLSG